MEDEENTSAANSEMRFITLELMKLAQQSGRNFGDIAQEYIRNTIRLQKMISGEGKAPSRIRRGAVLRQK